MTLKMTFDEDYINRPYRNLDEQSTVELAETLLKVGVRMDWYCQTELPESKKIDAFQKIIKEINQIVGEISEFIDLQKENSILNALGDTIYIMLIQAYENANKGNYDVMAIKLHGARKSCQAFLKRANKQKVK